MIINIKYHVPELKRPEQSEIGNWVDLRAAEEVELLAGEYRLISLGVSMKLPEGYEAWMVPRSSTFKTWGILQVNGIGVIDNSYSGTNDIWYFPAIAARDTIIRFNDRICQFRVTPVMERLIFEEASELDSIDRTGFGSTGAE